MDSAFWSNHFYPRSPCGERPLSELSHPKCPYFYPRSPCGERLCPLHARRQRKHFYPRSPCGERPRWSNADGLTPIISIHALLAESDCSIDLIRVVSISFLSTLSLRRATTKTRLLNLSTTFLSTLSLRRATNLISLGILTPRFLSTLSLRRATMSLKPC